MAILDRVASRTGWCMLALAVFPVALRLALLARHPVPTPDGADDFSYLLLADTLRHFRLANPMHPMRSFFEAVFILQEPSYSSIFPLGQGIVLALGWMVFGHPWAGVALSMAAIPACCYWMLRGWTTPAWSLAGGAIAALQFGPLCQWMNLYWGGAVSAVAGCLVFGAIPRLTTRRTAAPVLLGCGLAMQFLTRPFECILLALCIAPFLWRRWRATAIVAAVMLPAVGLTLFHNRAVSGSWTTLPYQVSRYQYGIPATFTVQPNPVPHRSLTEEQELDYRAQCIVHGESTDTARSFVERWVQRLRFYRFFFPLPLLLVLPAFLLALRDRRYRWVAITLLVFSVGTNFYPYFYPHYIAAVTSLFVLVGIVALQRLRPRHAAIVLALCAADFVFWYGLHAFATEKSLVSLAQYDPWDFINYGDPYGRAAIDRELARAAGQQLVFVRYSPRHAFREWIHNEADIDRARVVWAADHGPDENEWLQRYYPHRKAWLLEPDATPPRLTPYLAPPPLAPPAAPSAAPEPPPPLRFEDGPVNNTGGIREMQRKR